MPLRLVPLDPIDRDLFADILRGCRQALDPHEEVEPERRQLLDGLRDVLVERFHRTLSDGWAYARIYESTEQCNAALPAWLHFYNHHRAHSAIGGRPPATRLTNLPGHHS